jgi:hypothetical protein
MSPRTCSMISLALAPSIRPMSSWYFKSTPSVSETSAGSRATASSSVSALAQSSVSATPGALNRSCLRIAWTKATISSVSRAGVRGALARRIAISRAASG